YHHEEKNRLNSSCKRNAGGLYRGEFKMFTKVTVGDEGGQEHGQGQRGGRRYYSEIEEKLGHDGPLQSLPDDVVEVADHLDVQQNEHHHQERDHKRPQKGSQDELVQFFHTYKLHKIYTIFVQVFGLGSK